MEKKKTKPPCLIAAACWDELTYLIPVFLFLLICNGGIIAIITISFCWFLGSIIWTRRQWAIYTELKEQEDKKNAEIRRKTYEILAEGVLRDIKDYEEAIERKKNSLCSEKEELEKRTKRYNEALDDVIKQKEYNNIQALNRYINRDELYLQADIEYVKKLEDKYYEYTGKRINRNKIVDLDI